MPPDSTWSLAARLVAEGRRIVAEQRLLIARLNALGLSTKAAEELLRAFESSLAIFEEHEHRLRASVTDRSSRGATKAKK
jgi:hypothetical protein